VVVGATSDEQSLAQRIREVGITRLEFALDSGSITAAGRHVSIDIFDMRGRRVRHAVNRGFAEGTYAYTWDGRDDSGTPVPAGVYVAVMRSGSFFASRRLVLVR
jgi:flagellar hook assembly protein FlgD